MRKSESPCPTPRAAFDLPIGKVRYIPDESFPDQAVTLDILKTGPGLILTLSTLALSF